jgi:hypothetical protein
MEKNQEAVSQETPRDLTEVKNTSANSPGLLQKLIHIGVGATPVIIKKKDFIDCNL